jgi:hypothetical protein
MDNVQKLNYCNFKLSPPALEWNLVHLYNANLSIFDQDAFELGAVNPKCKRMTKTSSSD